MKLGAISDCFKRPMHESIKMASELGLSGIQMYAVSGEFCPWNLDDEAIGKYKKMLEDNNLSVSALCGDLGGHGFEIPEENPQKIARTKEIIDLAKKMGTSVVTTHIGVIPENTESEKYKVMLNALKECGAYAAQQGITLAIETGPEVASVLYGFVSSCPCGVGVNLDPANFVMVTGQDPAEAVYLLKDYIVHTHLKDGRRLRICDPVLIYKKFAEGGIEELNVSDFFIETPVGDGDVNWDAYIKALKDIGYEGYLTIERETGADPAADIAKAANFIREGGYL